MKYSEAARLYFYQRKHAISEAAGDDFLSASMGKKQHGDALCVYIKVENACFVQIRYRIRASFVAMACMEYVACFLENKPISALDALTSAQILSELQLSQHEQHRALLVLNAIKKALNSNKDDNCEDLQV